MRHKWLPAIILTTAFTPMATGIPIRPVKPIDSLEYRIVLRHRPVDSAPPDVPFAAASTKDGFVLHKLRGPQTIEVLLGRPLHGDFDATIDMDIAGFSELGIRPNGGTPVPYFGFRSSAGKHETYFLLSTYSGGWHSLRIGLRRQGSKISATVNGHAPSGFRDDCAEVGYITFVMNDTSKIRIRAFDVIAASSAVPRIK